VVNAIVVEAGKTAQDAEGGRDDRDYGQSEGSADVELPSIDNVHVIAILAYIVVHKVIALCHH